jgi:hypothetical protein
MNSKEYPFRESRRPAAAARAQAKKDELMADLIGTRNKILDAASSFTSVEENQVFLGNWTIKDLVAHLTGWDETNRRAVQAVRDGRLPEFYAFIDRDWQTYNARLVKEYNHGSLAELLSATRVYHQKLINVLQSIPAGEFEQDMGVRFKGYKVTIARLLQAELKDEKVHTTQIEEFRGKPREDRALS